MRWGGLAVGFAALLVISAACSPEQEPIQVPTLIVLPSITPTPTESPTPFTPTPPPTETPTITPTFTPSKVPTATFSPTPSATASPPATMTLTPAPTLGVQIFGELTAFIDTSSMMRTIADLANFGNRYTNSADGQGIYKARDYLTERMLAQAATCASPANFYPDTFDVVYQGLPSTQTNLVLAVTGTNAAKGVIVVGAHYDTMSKLPREHRDFAIQPGANDNGSGIAVTLEVARLICLQPRQQTIVFVLFAAEEIRTETSTGRVGSRHFVLQFLPNQGWDVRAMLNLDTIGSATNASGEIVADAASLYSAPPEDSPSRQLARQIQAAAYIQMPDFHLTVETREDRADRWGDHMSFTRAGYPAARLIEGSEVVDQQDSPQDLLNFIDPAYLESNLKVVLAFLLGESEGFPPPQNVRIEGTFVFWSAVPEVQSYLIARRTVGQSNYSFTLVSPDKTGFELERGTIFALGSIGSNGLLGPLTDEFAIAP